MLFLKNFLSFFRQTAPPPALFRSQAACLRCPLPAARCPHFSRGNFYARFPRGTARMKGKDFADTVLGGFGSGIRRRIAVIKRKSVDGMRAIVV